MTNIAPDDHKGWMQYAMSLAEESPPKPSNYRVGAVLLDTVSHEILATGYTLEMAGNTHAEQCCFIKMAEKHSVPEERLKEVLPTSLALYTTMEPCSKRLSGNLPCVDRVIRLAGSIKSVYVGVLEPKTFVTNTGRQALEDAGISVIHVKGLEKDILGIATAGHVQQG
jgi:pyrimidine deaminase RibD-like protein